MLPREPAREPTDPSGRAGVTVLEGRPAAEPERDCPEEDLPPTADLPVLLDERLTPEEDREVPLLERLTPEEERPVLEEDLDALLPVVLRRFWVLTDGRDAALPERDALEDERLTLDDERLTLDDERELPPEGRETLEDERLAPPPYEERPALDEEDRETEDELCPAEEDPRLAADAEWPPPPLD